MAGLPLERLGEIDWARVTHGYGPADDVPKQLRELASADGRARERALWELFGNLVHHGFRFEASSYAVPYLLNLAGDPEVPDRAGLLELLARLAVGDDDAYLPGGAPVRVWRERAAEPMPGLDEAASAWKEWSLRSDGRERTPEPVTPRQRAWMDLYWGLAAYDAVEAGVPLFRRLLRDAEPQVRSQAAYLLAWFPEHAAGSLPLLALHAHMEDEPAVAATMVAATGLLGTRRVPVVGGLLPDGLRDGEPLRRWAAAVALARRDGVGCSPEVREELAAQVVAGPPRERAGAPSVPFLSGDTRGYAALSLVGIGEPERSREAMLRALPQVWGADAVHLLEALLAVAFPRGPVASGGSVEALTSVQARVVRAIAEARNVWFSGTSLIAATAELVRGYGLPGTYEGCRRYAGLT